MVFQSSNSLENLEFTLICWLKINHIYLHQTRAAYLLCCFQRACLTPFAKIFEFSTVNAGFIGISISKYKQTFEDIPIEFELI